jgi:hypothetical protein
LEIAAAELAPQFQIPIFGNVLGSLNAVFVGCHAMAPPADAGVALPISAVLPFVDMEPAVHQFVVRHSDSPPDWVESANCVHAVSRISGAFVVGDFVYRIDIL